MTKLTSRSIPITDPQEPLMLCLNLPTLCLSLVHNRGYQESRVLLSLMGIGLEQSSQGPINLFEQHPFYRRVLDTCLQIVQQLVWPLPCNLQRQLDR